MSGNEVIRPTGGALAALLPASASVVATRSNITSAKLFPVESIAVDRAVEARRQEFATGRACARAALGRWGLSERPIPADAAGLPRWPAGIVGSITHCDGYRASAVARRSELMGVGIDAEPNLPLRDGVLTAVASDGELAQVRRLAKREPRIHWDRLLFSAKEAIFKAWFPPTARRLGFEDASLRIDPQAGLFSVLPISDAFRSQLGGNLSGRWALDGNVILTAVALSSAPISRAGGRSRGGADPLPLPLRC